MPRELAAGRLACRLCILVLLNRLDGPIGHHHLACAATQGKEHMRVKVVRVWIGRHEMTDLDSCNEIFVGARHDAIVLRKLSELRSLGTPLLFGLPPLFHP